MDAMPEIDEATFDGPKLHCQWPKSKVETAQLTSLGYEEVGPQAAK